MQVLDWVGVEAIEAEELSVIPGLDEVFSLADIKSFAGSGDYDVIVVDCAPTAETIRFLSLPDILSWYMNRIFPVERRLAKVMRPVISRVTSLPVANDDVFAAIRRFYDRLDGVRELLTDGETSSVRLGREPRAHGDRRGAAHRDLPRVVRLPRRCGRREPAVARCDQRSVVRHVEGDPRRAPARRSRTASRRCRCSRPSWRPRSWSGSTSSAASPTLLYGEAEAHAVFHRGEPLRIKARGKTRVLSLDLPFADKDDLEVARRDGELLVRVGPHRRAIVLPDSLRKREVGRAKMVDDRLEISFVEQGAAR